MNADASSFLKPLVRVDADNRLEQDLICNRCGYNLRGLKANGICVECTRPVIDSVLRPGGSKLRLRARLALHGALGAFLLLGISIAVVDPVQTPIRFGLATSALALAVFATVMGIASFKGDARTRRAEGLAIFVAFLLSATVIYMSINVGGAALKGGGLANNCTCD